MINYDDNCNKKKKWWLYHHRWSAVATGFADVVLQHQLMSSTDNVNPLTSNYVSNHWHSVRCAQMSASFNTAHWFYFAGQQQAVQRDQTYTAYECNKCSMSDECCTALAQQRKSLNMSQNIFFFRFLHVEGKSFPLLFAPFFIHLSVEAREKGNKKLISHFIGDVIT